MTVIFIKYILSSLILFVPYKLWFEKINAHYIKRYYLLAILVIPAIIPFISLPQNNIDNKFIITENPTQPLSINQYIEYPIEIVKPFTEAPSYAFIILIIYSSICIMLLIRFAYNLNNIRQLIKKNTHIKEKPYVWVVVESNTSPFTFFNYIFVNTKDYENIIPKAILLHEKAHAKQLHSVDILLFELCQIVFWVNPIMPLLKRSIQLNQEFLADNDVLNSNNADIKSYAYLLINQPNPQQTLLLGSGFNYKHIKTRLIMMTRKKSKKQRALLLTTSLLTICFVTFAFADRKKIEKAFSIPQLVQQEKLDQEKKPKQQNTGAPASLLVEYDSVMKAITTIKNDKNGKNIISRDLSKVDINKMAFITSLMSQEQLQIRTETNRLPPNIFWNNLITKPKQRIPTQKEFNSWSNAKIYGVWIDGKKAKNSDLLKLNNTDIVLYYVSKLHGKAKVGRSYTHQLDVYTQSGYDKSFKDYKENYVLKAVK